MKMPKEELKAWLAQLAQRGVTVEARAGRVVVKGVSKLSDQERATLRAHKDLASVLARTRTLAAPAAPDAVSQHARPADAASGDAPAAAPSKAPRKRLPWSARRPVPPADSRGRNLYACIARGAARSQAILEAHAAAFPGVSR